MSDASLIKEINREELAWAAGFFDGEGHCGYRNITNGYPYHTIHRAISLSVGQRYEEPLLRFQIAVLGLGKIYYRKDALSKPKFSWRTGKWENVQAISVMLWPFLCSIKQHQIYEAMNKYQQREGCTRG